MIAPTPSPCPFCGSNKHDVFNVGHRCWRCGCVQCGAMTGFHDTDEAAIAAWNRRASVSTAPPSDEALIFLSDVRDDLRAMADKANRVLCNALYAAPVVEQPLSAESDSVHQARDDAEGAARPKPSAPLNAQPTVDAIEAGKAQE